MKTRPEPHDTLGWAYYKQGLSGRAISSFERALALAPENATYHYHLGLAYLKGGDVRQGRAALARALALKPDAQTSADAQRLIAEGVKRVVIANEDPNPSVSGRGVAMLREAGIEVITGVLADDGEQLNEVFFHNQRTGLPFVHLKLAGTLDGRIAMPDGQSQWITGPEAREHAHRLRASHMAIAVGAGTVRKDDPALTARLPGYDRPQPVRVVFSRSGDIPPDCRVLSDADAGRTRLFIGG